MAIATLPVWLPLVLVGLAGKRTEARDPVAFLLLWIACSTFGMVLGGGWWPHYVVQLVPPLSVCAGHGISYLFRKRKLKMSVGATSILAIVIITLGSYYFVDPTEGASEIFVNPFVAHGDEIARYIATHTAESDTIFVAFSGAQIYYLAKRKSDLPYLYAGHVMYIPGAYEQTIELVKNRVPAYVVTSEFRQPMVAAIDDFWLAVEENYVVEESIDTVQIRRRR